MVNRPFGSLAISRQLGVTLRQIQWLDERAFVSPYRDGHRRCYSEPEALLVGIAQELRRGGVHQERLRQALAQIRQRARRKAISYIVWCEDTVSFPDTVRDVVGVAVSLRRPVVVIDVEQIRQRLGVERTT